MTRVFAILLLALTTAACEREQRRLSEASPASGTPQTLKMGQIEPGGSAQQVTIRSDTTRTRGRLHRGTPPLRAGQLCSVPRTRPRRHGDAAHRQPLDRQWSEHENRSTTIIQGRPNGMPAFRGRSPQQQAWQILAVGRSLLRC